MEANAEQRETLEDLAYVQKKIDEVEQAISANELDEIIQELNEEPAQFQTAEELLAYLNNREEGEPNTPHSISKYVDMDDDPKFQEEMQNEVINRLTGLSSPKADSSNYEDIERENLISEAVKRIKTIHCLIRKWGLFFDRETGLWKKPNC